MQGKTALPISSRRCLLFTGADRVRYLNGQTTNDVSKLTKGNAIHAAVCTNKGKMQGEIFISHTGESLQVDYSDLLADTLPLRLEKYIIADDVTMSEPSSTLQGFHFIGNTLPSMPEHVACYQSQRYGQSGSDVWMNSDQVPDFAQATPAVAEWIRIQTCTPLWGTDINEMNMPPEAYREHDTISYRKGCYIGQETIAKIKSIGRVNKKLCLLQGLTPITSLPAEVIHQQKKVGQVTSCQVHPNENGHFHALAILHRSATEAETALSVAGAEWQVVSTLQD